MTRKREREREKESKYIKRTTRNTSYLIINKYICIYECLNVYSYGHINGTHLIKKKNYVLTIAL